MKNKRIRIEVIVAALLIAFASIVWTYSAENAPGSEADPLVTKSYVDKKFSELKSSSGEAAPAGGWEVVQIEKGKSVIGGQGTEMILRSGEAVAVDNGVNGISDLTNARDLMSGDKITANSLLLMPRDDGRGIKCNTGCFVMILGTYTIK